MSEWIGPVGGFVLGAFVGPVLKPWSRRIEGLGRRLWREQPIDVHLETDQAVIWSGYPPWVSFRYFFPDGLPDEPPPSTPFDWSDWATRTGGVDFFLTMVELTIQAKLDASIVLGTPIVRIVDRHPIPATGSIAVCPAGGADLTPRHFEVELALSDPPIVDYRDEEYETKAPPAFQLTAGQAERFHVWAHARDSTWYDWTVSLPVIVDGTRITLPLADKNGPLSTVGDRVACSEFVRDASGWVERPHQASQEW